MRRVLLFTENLGSGGAERQLAGLALLLKQRGYEVVVLTYLERKFHKQYLEDNGVSCQLDLKVADKFFGLIYLYRDLKRINPDAVVSFLPAPNKRMCLMRMLCKFNLIVSERSHTLQWNANAIFKCLLYSVADYIVTNSVSELNNISIHCPWLRKKSSSIPNYVDVSLFHPVVNDAGAFHRLLCVGRLIPSKNVIRFLKVLDKLKNAGYKFFFTWVGLQYDKEYLSEVQNSINEMNLNDCVDLKNQTVDVVKEYQNNDIFCFPSLYEGYPNVLVEAMSCGLPVVCSNVCEMPNIVDDGVNGFLFNPLDVNDMFMAVCAMLNIPENEKVEMGIRNRNKVILNNSKEMFVEKYIELL